MESLDFFKNEKGFAGKNVIVTGATGGIGSLLIDCLVKMEANVIGVARNEKKVHEKLASVLKRKNFNYEIINFENPIVINRGFRNMMIRFKGKIDVFIMCHAVFAVGKLLETGIDQFDTAMNVNIRSCFHLMSLATPFLKISRGNVVAISSVESKIPVRDSFINSVTKSMLNSLIECSALELSSFGVRVNGIAPGMTQTNFRVAENLNENENKDYLEKMSDFFLLNKSVLQPNDIVNGILFLASEEAKFVTGEILTIDNGYSLNHDLSFIPSEEDN